MRRVLKSCERGSAHGIARQIRHADRGGAPATAARCAGRLLRHDPHVLPRRGIQRGILGTEESDDRDVERGGEMQWTAICGDQERGASQHLDQPCETGMATLVSHDFLARSFDRLGERFLTRPGDHTNVEASRGELPTRRNEPLDRPAFERAELAGARMQQHQRSSVPWPQQLRNSGLDRRVTTERGEQEPIERKVAWIGFEFDSRGFDEEQRSTGSMQIGREIDHGSIQAMCLLLRGLRTEFASGATGTQLECALQIPLEVDRDVVPLRSQGPQMARQSERGSRSRSSEPSPWERDDPLDAVHLCDEIREAILDQPVDRNLRSCALERAECRQRVQDVAECREANEENAFHDPSILAVRATKTNSRAAQHRWNTERGETLRSRVMEPRADAIHFLDCRDGRSRRFVRSDVAATLADRPRPPSVPDPWSKLGPVEEWIGGGRRRVEVRSLRGTGIRVVAKTLVRGGLLGRWLAGLAPRRRVEREIAIAQRLLDRLVPAVELLALRSRRVGLGIPFVRIDYLTAVVEGARDGERFLRDSGSRRIRCEVLSRAGEVVRAMHDAGIDHVDLNIRNLIVDPQQRVRVLDFGASSVDSSVSPKTRIRNLARLWRSCAKRGLAGALLSRADAMRFLIGYDRQNARTSFPAIHREFSRAMRWHRFAWWFSGIR